MTAIPNNLKKPLANLLLALADDKLMLGHRNSDWTGLGPILEEDIAFSHMAQDEMAHAQAIFQFVAEMLGNGKSADELAFGRKPEEYLCAHIVEVPDEFDWATAMARKFFCDHFDLLRLRALSKSSHKPLADLSRRIAAEEQLHVEHVDSWIKRLGRGTSESRSRMQRAIDALSPLAIGLFEPVEGQDQTERAGLYPASPTVLFDEWSISLSRIVKDAGLQFKRPDSLAPSHRDAKSATGGAGGRRGVHTPHLKALLDEMCEVYRIEPGAAW
jgi:ring-1,2-phenylacetyl-CoA epoxidase subunit PaaC